MKLPYWTGDLLRQAFYLGLLICGLLLGGELWFDWFPNPHDSAEAVPVAVLIFFLFGFGVGHDRGYKKGERKTNERRNTKPMV